MGRRLTNLILLQKAGEIFAFYFDDEPASLTALAETAAQMVEDPGLNFGESDFQMVREQQLRLEALTLALSRGEREEGPAGGNKRW